MADYVIPELTSAVVGFNTTTGLLPQVQVVNNVSITNGTFSVGNIDLSSIGMKLAPGWFTGRRPVSGQVFPRGVYNK